MIVEIVQDNKNLYRNIQYVVNTFRRWLLCCAHCVCLIIKLYTLASSLLLTVHVSRLDNA